MIEVVCAALIVALIAAAVFTGLSAAAHISGTQRYQSVAIELAQQDEQRLRGLTVQELVASASGGCASTAPLDGNGCYTQTIDNQTYTISSTAQFYSASNGSQSCTTSSVGSADYIVTTSKITWQNTTSQPVEEHSLITPASGGQIVVAVQDNAQSPTTGLSGATVTITGPGTNTSTQTQTTDSSGCALFVAIVAGSYSVSATIPSPYVTYGGTTTQSVQLANNQTQTVTFNAARAATINASFQTAVNGTASAIPFDTFSLAATSESAAQSFGTVGSYVTPPSTVSSGAVLYPYSSGYNAYAGTCTSDDPGSSLDTPVTVTEGGTTPATVNVPSMLLGLATSSQSQNTIVNNASAGLINGSTPSTTAYTLQGTTQTYTQGTGASGDGWSYSTGQSWNNTQANGGPADISDDEIGSQTANNTVSFTFTGTGVAWITSLDTSHGEANVALDGVSKATNVDLYGTQRINQVIGYEVTGLTNASHTLTITVNGTNDGSASGDWVPVDAFIVNPTVTQYDDHNANNTGLPSQVSYTPASDWMWSGTSGYSSDYDSDETWDATAGDTASLTFTGTGIEWVSKLSKNHGYANVSVVNTATSTVIGSATHVNLSTPGSDRVAYPAYGIQGLASGTYKITITVVGSSTEPPGATGAFVGLDELIVTAGQATSTPVTSWWSNWSLKTYDSCSTSVARALPSNPVATTVSSQSVFPVPAPYGTSLQVCIANSGTSTNTGELPSGSTQLSNTDFTGRTIQSLTLPTSSTATGNSAVFANSGSCP